MSEIEDALNKTNGRLIISVRDEKVDEFGALTLVQNEEVAKRLFFDLLCNGDSLFTRHPEDFRLYALGTFNLDSACIVSFPTPILICGSEVLINHVSKTN